MFAKQNNIEGGELGARLAVQERAGSGVGTSLSLKKALAAVNGTGTNRDITIRGASGVTVEVRELVKGTTAADVEASLPNPPSSSNPFSQIHRQFSKDVEKS